MFLYYSPSMLGLLLAPLLEQQNISSQFPYAAPDLGEYAYRCWYITVTQLRGKLMDRNLISECIYLDAGPARVY